MTFTKSLCFFSIHFVDKIKYLGMEKSLQCSVCLDRFEDPYITPCGHTYCRICISNVIGMCNGCGPCPQCRQPLCLSSIVPNRSLQDVITSYDDDQLSSTEEITICSKFDGKCKQCGYLGIVQTCSCCPSSWCLKCYQFHVVATWNKQKRLFCLIEKEGNDGKSFERV